MAETILGILPATPISKAYSLSHAYADTIKHLDQCKWVELHFDKELVYIDLNALRFTTTHRWVFTIQDIQYPQIPTRSLVFVPLTDTDEEGLIGFLVDEKDIFEMEYSIINDGWFVNKSYHRELK